MSEVENLEVKSEEVEANKPIILTFQMSLDNVNALLSYLGNLPYVEVIRFINIISSQAASQMQFSEEEFTE